MSEINAIDRLEPESTDEQDGRTGLGRALVSVLMFVLLCFFNFCLGALQVVWRVGLAEAWDRNPAMVLLAAVPVGLVLAVWVNDWLNGGENEETNPFARDWSGFHVTGGYGDGEGEEGDCGNDSFGDVGFGDCGD